ncbi:MAG: alpha-glucan family phosphorylase [Bacteroidota bacterium]
MNNKPDYIFEIGWEVCNKVGGMHTVLSTKANTLTKEFNDNYILIGPDVWKETKDNPEFIEDKKLLKNWRAFAEQSKLKIRVGRWNIQGKPIVILVDFSSFIISKDAILADFWKTYQLDSISGQWDFLEPTIFGYATGKVIENFWQYNVAAQDKIVAHFNEWTSGAGILYLKKEVPQVATVYTSHGTTLGKSLAKNDVQLLNLNETIDPEMLSFQYQIRAKFSLEKLLAENADCFTTVSSISNKECELFYNKPADFITPNGFENTFIATPQALQEKRIEARKILRKVARAVLKREISDDTIFIHSGGRNEFKNKGYDVLIDALGRLNQKPEFKGDVVAFFIVPSNTCGFRQDLDLERVESYPEPAVDDYLTHWIFDYDVNPIVHSFIQNNLHNKIDDKVKVIYIPTYLNGDDGIINTSYYDLVSGFDLTLFPSLYEPWGYSSQESVGLGIPTVTTSLSGFGLWVKEQFDDTQNAVKVINRDHENIEDTINELAQSICDFSKLDNNGIKEIREKALKIGKSTHWCNVIKVYYDAYNSALIKALSRFDVYKTKLSISEPITEQVNFVEAEWRKILISINLPEALKPLQELTKNLWWVWNYEAVELFEMIDEQLWTKHQHNPISMIESLSIEKYEELAKNPQFLKKLAKVYDDFCAYMAKKSDVEGEKVAYFSMEYGLHDSLKIFSGGLGMLAGDYLKQASDSNVNLIGIGLLYRYGYFSQQISNSGDQIDNYYPQKFSHLPINPQRDSEGNWMKIGIPFPGRTLYAKIWRVDVGRIPLYLLDTDFADNNEADRKITASLYGGDWENRLKQEILLGIGGVLAINSLNENPTLFHYNEGHAAFAVIERLKNILQQNNFSFSQGVEIVRASSLFTTHTPVPAGHDCFTEDMLRVYMSHYPAKLNINWEAFMNLGRMHENNSNERFSMSVLAVKLSQEVNAVSKIHGRVTREMFKDLYKGYFTEELHIGYVTNGVHYPTWTHKRWQQLHREYFGEKFLNDQSNKEHWKKIYDVPDARLWNLRNEMRAEMIDYLKIRLAQDMTRRQENPKLLFDAIDNLRSDVLTIGFARRFATYKRAHLLFSDLEKLSALINHATRPVQFIYAGKAHPHDKAGQDLIKRIIEVSRMKEFIGKVIFIENYDMNIAKHLISGCDIWLNTPTRPLEASGTSGEKAIMNGVLNFSVLDGWWAEGYTPGAGWALKEEVTYDNNDFQDVLDAETIYNKIEDEIAPTFYQRNEENISEAWLSHVRKTFAEISPMFTMKRQLDDYYDKFYGILFDRYEHISENNFDMAYKISRWKQKMLTSWDAIEILRIDVPNSEQNPLSLGDHFHATVTVDLGSISPEDIGIEILFARKVNDKIDSIYKKFDLEFQPESSNYSVFSCKVPAINAGVYDYVFRIYAKNSNLAHRQDFELIRWF